MSSSPKDADREAEIEIPITPSRERWFAMSPREQLEFLRAAKAALDRKREAEGRPRFALLEAMAPEARPLLDRLSAVVEQEERQHFEDQLAACDEAERLWEEQVSARKHAQEQAAQLLAGVLNPGPRQRSG